MGVVGFWVSSFSVIFFLTIKKLNRILKLSEEQLIFLTRYYEARWWTQILVGQGSIQHVTSYLK